MRRLTILMCIAVLSLFSISALAQSDTARLVGTITDASGAAIPNATITVTNKGTARAITASTNSSGEYVVNALPPGDYHVDVKQPSFKTASADITLEVSQVREISLKLQAGSVETVVNVTDEVPLVETTTSSTGEVIQGRQVTELPLNGRNFTQLALLTPGVTRGAYGDVSMGGGSGTNAEAFRNSETGGASISANGLRAQANNFILDGVDNNEGMVNSIVFFPPAKRSRNSALTPALLRPNLAAPVVQSSRRRSKAEAIPFTVPLLNFVVAVHLMRNLITRPVPSTLSGISLAEHLVCRSGRTGCSSSAITRVCGSLRRRTWNLRRYRRIRCDREISANCWERTFHRFRALAFVQASTPAEVLCQRMPARAISIIRRPASLLVGTEPSAPTSSPTANPVWSCILARLSGAKRTGTILNNFRAQRQSIRNFNDFDVRLDLVASQRDTLFARYSYGQDNFTVTNRLGPNNPSGFGSGDNFNHPRGVALGYTHTFSDSVLNEFRFGYLRPSFGYNPPNIGQTLAADIGIPNANRNAFLGGKALIGGNNTQLEYQGDGVRITFRRRRINSLIRCRTALVITLSRRVST